MTLWKGKFPIRKGQTMPSPILEQLAATLSPDKNTPEAAIVATARLNAVGLHQERCTSQILELHEAGLTTLDLFVDPVVDDKGVVQPLPKSAELKNQFTEKSLRSLGVMEEVISDSAKVAQKKFIR